MVKVKTPITDTLHIGKVFTIGFSALTAKCIRSDLGLFVLNNMYLSYIPTFQAIKLQLTIYNLTALNWYSSKNEQNSIPNDNMPNFMVGHFDEIHIYDYEKIITNVR